MSEEWLKGWNVGYDKGLARGYDKGWHAAMNDAVMILLAVMAGYPTETIMRELGIV